MKPFLSWAGLLALCVVLWGCPYESRVPLDKPTTKIDNRLLGKWQAPDDKSEITTVSRQDDYTYIIEIKNDKRPEAEKATAYLTMINGVAFLNFAEKKNTNSPEKYSFFKITFEGIDKIVVSTVTENIDEQFGNSEQIKKFFAGNMKNSYFFEKKDNTLIKVGK